MIRKWIVSFGGMGLLPAMPGTYASLVAAAIFYLLWRGLGVWVYPLICASATILAVLGGRLWPWAQEHFKSNDPRPFVLDEVVGQWLTLAFVPLAVHPLSCMAAGFFLYRAFDVAKPWPIRQIERLPRGWGVMLDDVAAAAYAAAGLWILRFLVQLLPG